MSDLTKDVKSFMTLNFDKQRDDSITDQYNRVLMVKVLLAAVLVTGLNWNNDDINCVVPEDLVGKHLPSYAKASCWINGFYIYKELKEVAGFEGYYGIPTSVNHNGTFGESEPSLTRTCVANGANPSCKPMTKEFYLQYQYFPFFLAALSVLYYLPYACFYRLNSDLRSLKGDIEKEIPNYSDIVATYFDKRLESFSQNLRVVLNLLIKCAHLVVHVVAFIAIDFTTNGNFRAFFGRWMDWSELSNEDAHNYVGMRKYIKPGENMLPTFGYCDVLEESLDVKHELLNEHRFICEISQNIMYHYVLLAVWCFLIVGLIVSSVGILEAIFRILYHQTYLTGDEGAAREVYPKLTIRQRQYMDYICKMNMERYGVVLRKLFVTMHPADTKGLLDNVKEEEKEEEKEKEIYQETIA